MRRREIERHLCSGGPSPATHESPADSDVDLLEPSYADYCVSNVTESLLSLLDPSFDAPLPDDALRGVETDVETVVFVLLDGFGYDEWTRLEETTALPQRFDERGVVTPLTSVYPSETAAAFTSIQTGRPPLEHGLLGWFQYMEALECDVVTLPFETLDGTPLERLDADLDGTALYDATPLSARTTETPVTFEAILPESIGESAYSRAIFDGANRRGYADSSTFAGRIRETVESSSGPTFVHAYEPSIDAVAHEDGIGSRRCRATMTEILAGLQSSFVDELSPETAERTLLVVGADHGLVDTVPAENVDVREWEFWPELQGSFRQAADGAPRLPTGGSRNTHFHVQPDHRFDVRSRLDEAVDGIVETRDDAVDEGLFGHGTRSALFDRRCGEVIALDRNRGLCWRDDGLDVVGRHGGLTRDEMLVPFAAARVDAL